MSRKMIRNRLTSFIFLVMPYLMVCFMIYSFSYSAHSAEYAVDPDHTNVMFTIRHLLGRFTGSFREIEAKFKFDEKNPTQAFGQFTVRVDHLNTGVEARDAHLRSADFFEVIKYPSMRFETKKLVAVAPRRYKLTGDLTIRGVTKPVTFDVQYFGSAISIDGDRKASFRALASISRKDFNVSWNKIVDRNLWILGDKVDITMNIEAREIPPLKGPR